MGALSVEGLAIKIGEMRRWVRARNVDIRANTRIIKELYTFLSQVPKKRVPGEQVAAEEYEKDDVDARDIRAQKRNLQSEAEDPSYLGQAALPRGANLAVNTRATKMQKLEPRKETNGTSRTAKPTTTAARSPTRDAANPPTYASSSNSGQHASGVNPYTQAYTVGSSAAQRLNGGQPGQSQQPVCTNPA